MSVRRDRRDVSKERLQGCLSKSNCRNVSKEGLHGCQLGEIAGMSVRRDCMDVS